MTQENKASKGLLITLPAAIIAIVLILGKIDTPVTNILFYVVAFGVMGLTVSSLIKDYKKRKIDYLFRALIYIAVKNRIMNPSIEETSVTKIRFHDLRHTMKLFYC
ncbi:hypothetical protein J2W41_002485 [Bacillus pumilus]|nr:hypothetical protein [Bacillus pumilus]